MKKNTIWPNCLFWRMTIEGNVWYTLKYWYDYWRANEGQIYWYEIYTILRGEWKKIVVLLKEVTYNAIEENNLMMTLLTRGRYWPYCCGRPLWWRYWANYEAIMEGLIVILLWSRPVQCVVTWYTWKIPVNIINEDLI